MRCAISHPISLHAPRLGASQRQPCKLHKAVKGARPAGLCLAEARRRSLADGAEISAVTAAEPWLTTMATPTNLPDVPDVPDVLPPPLSRSTSHTSTPLFAVCCERARGTLLKTCPKACPKTCSKTCPRGPSQPLATRGCAPLSNRDSLLCVCAREPAGASCVAATWRSDGECLSHQSGSKLGAPRLPTNTHCCVTNDNANKDSLRVMHERRCRNCQQRGPAHHLHWL